MWLKPNADLDFFEAHLSADTYINSNIWNKQTNKQNCAGFWNKLDSLMALISHLFFILFWFIYRNLLFTDSVTTG